MKYNKVGVIVMSMAVLLMALPSAAATIAEDQKPENNTKRNQESEQSITSSEKNRNESAQEQGDKRDEDRDGIGEEVRKIAKEEDDSAATTTEAIKKIEDRSSFKTFLIGTDYKNIGVIRSQIAKTQARIDQLSRLLDQATSSTVSVSTTQQLETLKQTEDKLANFISEHENKFSLFGWFVRIFSK